ncbi:hypothetical protein C8R43DRAFT_622345 [Mycena crocata]|nr:hypothetical protein C8R43DRAFT_622345 [Mycena crocata]
MNKNTPWCHFYLPAIYAILDPTRIPMPDELDPETGQMPVLSVAQARITLMTLHAIPPTRFPPGIFPYLWPRIAAWVEIVTLHRHCLPQPIPEEHFMSVLLLRTVVTIFAQLDKTYCAFILATPGLRLLLARVWKESVARGDIDELAILTLFLPADRITTGSPYLEEYIEGTGGTANDLCSLAVRHLTFLTSHPSTLETVSYIQAILAFTWTLIDGVQLLPVFRECGLSRAITKVIATLSGPNIKYDTNTAVDTCFSILHFVLRHSPGPKYVSQMLKAGLLPAIVALGQRNTLSDYAVALLRLYFPVAMLHYPVVCQVQASLPAITDLPIPPSSILDDWKLFCDAAQARIADKGLYDGWKPLRACDNMVCGLITTKTDVRCCSGCRKRVYCSAACQAVDWRDADHRSACHLLRASEPDPASPRDRGFMRLILQHNYGELQVQILSTHFKDMLADPQGESYTVFDYDTFPPKMKVHRMQHLERRGYALVPGPNPDPMWADYAARARRSGGRMHLHILNRTEGGELVSRIIPLRFNSAALYDGMRKIIDAIPPGTDVTSIAGQLGTDLADLFQNITGVIQIHSD